MKSRKLWGSFASLILVSLMCATALYACAGGDDESAMYIGLFRPDISELQGREAAYFYPDAILAQWKVDTEKENIDDWKQFLKGATEADVRAFVYEMPLSTLKQLRADVESGKTFQAKAPNAFVDHIVKQRDLPLLDYVIFARESATLFQVQDPWDYKAPDAVRMSTLLDRAKKGLSTANNNFLKVRYQYQILRVLQALGDYEGVIQFYSNAAKMHSWSPVLNWSRSIYAGALYRTKEYARAYAAFADVFEASTRYRASALMGGRWAVQSGGAKVADEALRMMDTPQGKADVLALTAYLKYDSALELISKIADLTPKNPELEVLIAREINKFEMVLQPLDATAWNSFIPGEPNASKKSALAKVTALEKIVGKLRQQGENPALWETTAAYLAYLQGDLKAMRKLMASSNQMKKSQKVEEQLGILSLLLDAQTLPLNEAGEAKLLASLRPLAERIAKTPIDARTTVSLAYEDRAFAHIVGHVLSDRYAKEGRIDKEVATILLPQRLTNFVSLPNPGEYGGAFARMQRATPAEMEKIRRYTMAPKTDYDRFLLKGFPYSFNKLTEIEGTRYLDTHDFKGASKVLKQMKEEKNNADLIAFGEPLRAYAVDGFQLPATLAEGITVKGLPAQGGKLAFAEAMAALEPQVKNPKTDEDYRAAYVYAKGLYNMGSRGNSWELSQYDRYNFYQEVPAKDRPKNEFYTANAARKLFEKVGTGAPDPELRARALFMAALSLQQTTDWSYDTGSPTGSYFTDNRYFKELKKNYTSTQFYQDAVGKCSFLRDFK